MVKKILIFSLALLLVPTFVFAQNTNNPSGVPAWNIPDDRPVVLKPVVIGDSQGNIVTVNDKGQLEVNSNVTVSGNNSIMIDDEGDTKNISVNQTYDSAVLSLAEGDTHQWSIGDNCNGTGGPGCTEIDITPVGGTVHHAFGDASVAADTFTMPIINSASFEETNKDAEFLEVYNPTDGSGTIEVYVRTWD